MKWFFFVIVVLLVVGCGQVEVVQNEEIPVETKIAIPPTTKKVTMDNPKVAIATRSSATPFSIVEKTTSTPQLDWKLCSPLAEHEIGSLNGIISSPYNPPPMGKDDRHQGVDFAYYNQDGRASIQGEGVTAILGGWVAAILIDRLPYGNMVMIETPYNRLPAGIVKGLEITENESLYHLYAHMEGLPEILISQWVGCGDLLGTVGKTGYNIPVAHLHLETRIGPAGWRFEGMAYYDTQATEIERENYVMWRMSGMFRHFDPMCLFDLLEP